MSDRVIQWLVYQWAAVLWTLIGLLGGRWAVKLLRRWIPTYFRYRRTRPHGDVDRDYAWSRMMKSICMTWLELVVVAVGTLVMLGPTGQGDARTFRGYVVVAAMLMVDACASYVCYLMDREDRIVAER